MKMYAIKNVYITILQFKNIKEKKLKIKKMCAVICTILQIFNSTEFLILHNDF